MSRAGAALLAWLGRGVTVGRLGFEVVAQHRELLREGAGAVLEAGELPRQVDEHEQEERDGDHEEDRGRVLDTEPVGEVVEQAGDERADDDEEAGREPEQGVLAAELAAADEPQDEPEAQRRPPR